MTKRRPDGLLVLYDEGKGLPKPQSRVFSPSPRIEAEVNEWIGSQDDILVQRIEWLPSGGLLGASVTYTRGVDPGESLHIIVPGLEALAARVQRKKPLERFGLFLLTFGIALGFGGLAMFALFFPETWYGGSGALTDANVAIQATVLTLGCGIVLIFAGLSALFRARVT